MAALTIAIFQRQGKVTILPEKALCTVQRSQLLLNKCHRLPQTMMYDHDVTMRLNLVPYMLHRGLSLRQPLEQRARSA